VKTRLNLSWGVSEPNHPPCTHPWEIRWDLPLTQNDNVNVTQQTVPSRALHVTHNTVTIYAPDSNHYTTVVLYSGGKRKWLLMSNQSIHA